MLASEKSCVNPVQYSSTVLKHIDFNMDPLCNGAHIKGSTPNWLLEVSKTLEK